MDAQQPQIQEDAAAQTMEKGGGHALDRWAEDLEMEAAGRGRAGASHFRRVYASGGEAAGAGGESVILPTCWRTATHFGEVHPDDGGQDPRDFKGAAKGTGHRSRSGGGHHGGHGCAGWRRKAMKTALAETADAVGDTMALLRPATEKLLTSLESTA